jgi:hypothetical protein
MKNTFVQESLYKNKPVMIWLGRNRESYWLRAKVLSWTNTEVVVFCFDGGYEGVYETDYVYEMPTTLAKHPVCVARAFVSCMFREQFTSVYSFICLFQYPMV